MGRTMGQDMNLNIEQGSKKRVVIVGGGFGGLELAKRLNRSGLQTVLVDKHNYHQFQPLIYQVASAGMEPSSISFPFRKIFQHHDNFYFRMAEVQDIFPDERRIHTSIGDLTYDYLVLAAGATTNFYGNKNIEARAMPMKSLSEATAIRNLILGNIEKAITCTDRTEKQELLNVVIVGGGATGVELAGVLAELKKTILPYDYPDLDSSLMNIYLIQGNNRLLPGMAVESSKAAEQFLRSMGVNVILSKLVTDFNNHKAIMEDGSKIATRNFIWVSGITGVHFGNMPDEKIGRGGRCLVDQFNKVQGYENVFAIGDIALMTADKNYPNGHPQLAQVAIQQGKLLAMNIKRLETGKKLAPFRYKDLGSMATIGRKKAVAELAIGKTQGFIAWALWLVVHLRSILGIRNKVIVLLNWMWNYANYKQSLRLIFTTGRQKNIEASAKIKEDM